MKTALIFGSSGLVGNELLNVIRQNNNYNKIKLFVRSFSVSHGPKIEIIKTDFNNLENYRNSMLGDDCFFCIGTTRKETPDKNEYRRVEYNLPVDIAKIAKSNSVKSFIYVSSIGANSNSSSFYLKNKGQVEEELNKINFSKLAIIRPSILLGNRKVFRLGEVIGIFIMKTLSIFFLGSLKKYKPIQAQKVAEAMVSIVQNYNRKTVFESDELNKPIRQFND
jgi:nucleoside-diphosphate-sugar epimerase